MRRGPRLLVVALVAVALVGAAPAASARGGNAGQPGTPPAPAKAAPLATDVARFEPLATDGDRVPTVTLQGVGEYRGIVEARRAGPGIGAVNEVALDDYLKGIAEVPSSWPPEVLRAQAIAARTYLLWVLGNGPAGSAAALGAQICATESCQVYSGVAKERAPHGANWAAAVRDTSGQVLLSEGSPILAKYSACNGGRSVSGGKPYLKAVDDPDDARCPLHKWGLAVSYDDLGRALGVTGRVTSVRATAGDVHLEWTGDGDGGRLTVPRTQFRARVGAAVAPPPDRSRTVPSILFTLRADDGARLATLDGRGFGHGIGMSQWGAYGKGLRGMKAAAILAAYYGGIRPSALPADKLPARVRVAVEDGKAAANPAAPRAAAGIAEAVVSASGPFRILDSKDRVVVPVATGTWRVVPAGKGVRLVPPKGQNGPPGVTVVGIEPAAVVPGQPVTVRFRSNLPAVVSAAASPPGGTESPVLEPRVAGTEEQRLTLPPAAGPGIYSVTLTADAGPGRVATTTVAPVVVSLAPPPEAAPPAGDNALAQELVATERVPSARASRAAPVRTVAPPASDGPSSAGRAGLGAVLAALAGLGLWRFRVRARPAADPPADLAPVPPDGPGQGV